MAATALVWQPRDDGLAEICALLEQQISPSSVVDKSQIWKQLQHFSQFPDFNNYLVFILVRAEGKSVEVRQAAGLLLKNNLRGAYPSMAQENQKYIKSELLPCLGAADRNLFRTLPKLCAKPRMLVCAPSNAATDELLSRVLNRGFIDGEMKKYHPDVARVGVDSQTVAAQAVSVERRSDQLLAISRDEFLHHMHNLRLQETQISRDITGLKMELNAAAFARC